MIVSIDRALTLVGGADLALPILNICTIIAPDSVAADGGADHLHRFNVVPIAVIGDMDSISDAARAAFVDRLCPILEQETTDFEKALTRVDAPVILAPGFLGGRLDHTYAALNVLVRHADRPVVLVGSDGIAFVARQGQSALRLKPNARFALLPMGQAKVTTTGLCWDLMACKMQPDGIVSSSNAVADGPVALDVSGPVIITLPLDALEQAIAYVKGDLSSLER